jgi:hypothetical protein
MFIKVMNIKNKTTKKRRKQMDKEKNCNCQGKCGSSCKCKNQKTDILVWAGKTANFHHKEKIIEGIVVDIHCENITLGYFEGREIKVVTVKRKSVLRSNNCSEPSWFFIKFNRAIHYKIHGRDSRKEQWEVISSAIEAARVKTNEEIKKFDKNQQKYRKKMENGSAA